MSTVFTTNPIKLNIISTKNTIKKTVVFIGIVPNEVKNELIKIETGKYNPKHIKKNSILDKFYGKNWDIKLGIKNSIFGGDDFSFDDTFDDTINESDEIRDEQLDEIISEITEDVNADNQEIVEDELKQLKDKTNPTNIKKTKKEFESQKQQEQPNEEVLNKDNLISLDDLDDDLDEDDKPEILPAIKETSQEKITQITKTEGKMTIKFIFSDPYISIYPEDKVLEFKKKIYCILNIPIFRQHIWYVYQGRTYPLNYSIFENNSLLYINVQNMLANLNDTELQSQLIEGIPVNQQYYQKKARLKIITHDTFSILDEFYHKYGVTEYNLLDLDEFIAPSKTALVNILSDKYQMELIYYSFIILYWPMLSLQAFLDYIKSEKNIPNFYPELQPPIQELSQIYKLEKKIIDEKIDLITNPKKKESLKKIRGTITNSITESIISVLKYQNSKDSIIFIRNLFDIFNLDEKVFSCKCHMTHNGRKIILNKSFKSNIFIKEMPVLDSIMFKIKVSKDSNSIISLSFFKNGNYIIKSPWREEDQYDFDDIFNICYNLTKPVIDKINSFGSYVLALKKTLPTMNKHNSKFTEIGMSMFYKKAFTQSQFLILKDLIDDYRKANIVRDKMSDKMLLEYYFSKGMYQFKSERIERVTTINNYYDFLTDGMVKQKWFTIFDKTRITRIQHRVSDIKIEIVGIKEKEFFIFYNFVLTLFYLFNNKCNTNNVCKKEDRELTTERKLKKSLRNLKEQDPILYNFKKHYKTENVYSKICQKPYQPLLLTKQGYNDLPKDKKDKAVKYWNFTTNKDAYYSCPNPKYPYIKFIVKRHPKDYCIPCCKKMQVSQNKKDAKKIIYDICLNTHKYEKAERTITLGSRYIMSYGKDVEPGRLSRLPETSLEPLFYETYSVDSPGIDAECITTDGYYLYGVEQNINNVKNVGILVILINATETNIQDFINNIIKLLKSSPNKFRIILDGNISNYFNNLNEFISQLQKLFLSPNAIDSSDKHIPWNEIFVNIAYLFLNINIIYFQHKRHDNVNLILPSYITNKEQFLSQEFTNLLILQKKNKFFPIYLLNTDVFFKVKMINQKLFKYNDPIIIIIERLVSEHFHKDIKNITNNITLSIIQSFVQETDYKIQKLFINSSNMCYYVHLTNKNNNIYLPIELSNYLTSAKINVTYEMFLRNKANMNIDTLTKFIKEFNHWIAQKSEKAGMIYKDVDKHLPLEKRVQPIYPYIKIYSWLVLSNIYQTINHDSKVIGFTLNNINYYTNTIKLKQALHIQNAPLTQVFYDPDDINKSIYTKPKNEPDQRSKTIGKSIYQSNLYQLILLEFMTIFNNQKNNTLRKKIKHILLKNFNKDFDDIMNTISKLVIDCDDYFKIKTQICEFINKHHSKNLLFNEIDNTFYKFDRETFERIKKLPENKLYDELEKIAHKFITYGDVSKIKDFEFPNMFITCQDSTKLASKSTNKFQNQHCKNNKLIINKHTLKKLLDIMASDILNPVKEKWIFSSVFSDNIINFFKFIRRPDELISIEVID